MKEENAVQRLPLWRNVVDDMRKDGVAYGKVYDAAYFETGLKCERNTMHFGLAISEIRRELERDGFYLSGRGQKGNQFVIQPVENNADIMRSYQCKAVDAMKRGVILGTATKLSLLNESDRRKHESLLEKMALRVALVSRSQQIAKVVAKQKPQLLKDAAG